MTPDSSLMYSQDILPAVLCGMEILSLKKTWAEPILMGEWLSPSPEGATGFWAA
jgi:hypothetical protein